MDKTDFDGSIADKGSYTSCGETIFTQEDSAKVTKLQFNNDAATAWYAGESEYNYDNGKPKDTDNSDKVALSRDFT